VVVEEEGEKMELEGKDEVGNDGERTGPRL